MSHRPPSALLSPLFEPLHLGPFTLAHRVVRIGEPLRQAHPLGLPSPVMLQRYSQHARAGALLISEPAAVRAEGMAHPAEPGLHTCEQVNRWREITDAVHARGGLLLAQLGHVARPVPGEPGWPLGPDAMDQLVLDYRNAAENAGDAGFDGVELQVGDNTLTQRLLFDSNSPQEGARGVGDLLQALVVVWGARHIGIRLPVDIDTPATRLLLADLAPLELAYAHVQAGFHGDGHRPWRQFYPGLLLVSGEVDLAAAAQGIAAGAFDAAGFGFEALGVGALETEG